MRKFDWLGLFLLALLAVWVLTAHSVQKTAKCSAADKKVAGIAFKKIDHALNVWGSGATSSEAQMAVAGLQELVCDRGVKITRLYIVVDKKDGAVVGEKEVSIITAADFRQAAQRQAEKIGQAVKHPRSSLNEPYRLGGMDKIIADYAEARIEEETSKIKKAKLVGTDTWVTSTIGAPFPKLGPPTYIKLIYMKGHWQLVEMQVVDYSKFK